MKITKRHKEKNPLLVQSATAQNLNELKMQNFMLDLPKVGKNNLGGLPHKARNTMVQHPGAINSSNKLLRKSDKQIYTVPSEKQILGLKSTAAFSNRLRTWLTDSAHGSAKKPKEAVHSS